LDKGSKMDYTSADGNKILLPYNSADLLTDTAEIIAAIIAETNTAPTPNHNTAETSITAHSVQFYISLNIRRRIFKSVTSAVLALHRVA